MDLDRINLRKEVEERDEGLGWLTNTHFGVRVLGGFRAAPIQFWAIFFPRATEVWILECQASFLLEGFLYRSAIIEAPPGN